VSGAKKLGGLVDALGSECRLVSTIKKTGKTKRMPMAQAAMPAMVLPVREPSL
jgi:hypothetical protein